ncbi:MAG TPA: OmpA family protein [Polyangiaceae bacterium]|nr:OmpA family protein [Polyangiaceae bacterium]
MTDTQREDARRLAAELRFGLSSDPDLQLAAQRLQHALLGAGPLRPQRFGSTLETQRSFDQLRDFLEEQLEAGGLVVRQEPSIANVPEQELTVRRPRLEGQPPGDLVPRREPPLETSFEVRFVDEIGQAIGGFEVLLAVGDRRENVTTNAAGVALLEGTTEGSGTVKVLDFAALEKVLEPRWSKRRIGKAPGGLNTTAQPFDGQTFGALAIKAGTPNTVVIKPKLAKLSLQLWDKSGRTPHAKRKYTITGPEAFEGETDEQGQLLHEAVTPGDYTLEVSLVSYQGDPDEIVETATTQVVAFAEGAGATEIRMIGALPHSTLARLNAFFNTNKAFLLPSAMPAVQKLRELYGQNTPSKLLVVGHADTAGGVPYNDKLALARAEATIAYLKDDVDAWLKFYETGVEAKQRWGKVEDHLMITAMADFVTKPKGEAPVHWYQRTRELTVDNQAGKQTRTKLIAEYMALDGASLADLHGKIEAIAHGCGEHFPLDDTAEQLDRDPSDEKRDRLDRRVELFFFDPEFGINPPPPSDVSAANSQEYPKWRERLSDEVDLVAGENDVPEVIFAEIADTHFRTDSAVVLPEGELPDKTEHQSLTSVGVIAHALRFIEDNPDKTVLVAGHTDSTADIAYNQKLSEERAAVTLAMLTGDRDSFARLCDARHTVADIKQILSWLAQGGTGLPFDCDPGKIDDNGGTLSGPVTAFQRAFNANKSTLGSSAADLKPDGSLGKLSWGAIFDCYEFALGQELGEPKADVTNLRSGITFADPDHRSLGFSEYFPIEELGVDNFRSQSNRRTEIVFFDRGEEPDLAHAADDPETSELYLPGHYQRGPLPELTNAKRQILNFTLVDHLGLAYADTAVVLFLTDGTTRTVVTDADGLLNEKVPVGVTAIELPDGRMVTFGGSYADYKHDPISELNQMTQEPEGALSGSELFDMDVDAYNSSMSALGFDDSPLP